MVTMVCNEDDIYFNKTRPDHLGSIAGNERKAFRTLWDIDSWSFAAIGGGSEGSMNKPDAIIPCQPQARSIEQREGKVPYSAGMSAFASSKADTTGAPIEAEL